MSDPDLIEGDPKAFWDRAMQELRLMPHGPEMVGRIEQLERELAAKDARIATLEQTCKEFADDETDYMRERAEKDARLLKAERDARRYRWLRTRINWRDRGVNEAGLSWQTREWTHYDYRDNPPASEHIDEYIDAALASDDNRREPK